MKSRSMVPEEEQRWEDWRMTANSFFGGQWECSKVDCGDGCTTLWIYLKSLDCTHEVVNSMYVNYISIKPQGLPQGLSGKESTCQCRIPALVGKLPWRRKRQLTPVFLPENSHGQRRLMGYSPWGHKRVVQTASKHVYYQGWNRLPAQVGCMRQALRPGALGGPGGSG